MKKLIIFLVLVCMSFSVPCLVYADQGVTKDSIKIGVMTDLTGVSAVWGEILKNLGDMWASEVNSKGGIHGRKIEMVYGDHAYRPDKALSEAKRLVDFEKIFCFVAGLNTPTNLVAADYAEKKGIPWLFPINSLVKYAKETRPTIFNFFPLHEPATKICVDYAVKTWKPKKFGVFYQYDEYGKTELANIEEQLSKHGMKIATAEHFKKGALSVSAEVARMKAVGCDTVLILGYTNITASFLKDASRIGWTPHFLGSISSSNDNMLKLAGEAAEGMVCPFWFNSPDTHNEGMDNLRELVKKHYPEKQLDVRYLQWPAYPALERALELAGPDLTAQKIVDSCESNFKEYSIGIIGPVTYSKEDHKGAESALLRVVKDGKYQEIPGWTGFLTPKN